MATATTDAGKPRFKQELVAEAIEDNGTRFIDVMDPDSGNVFRFYEVEYAIACAMDGERDVAGIVKWAQEELGVTPTPHEVTSVIATLGNLGYLDDGAAPAPTATAASAHDELAQGIVVGRERAAAPAAEDFGLGAAGATEVSAPASTIEVPDLDLGKPGVAAAAPAPTHAAVDDLGLGQAGASPRPITTGDSIPTPTTDVSLDLSNDMPIGLGDVKEAVRASKVMTAVEVPKELLDALEDKPEAKPEPKPVAAAEPKVEVKPEPKPEPKVEAKPEPKPEPKAEKKPEPKVEKKPEPKPEPKAEKKPEPKAEKKPEPKAEKKPVAETKAPVPPAPEKKGPSGVLIALLVLVLLAGGGFVVWKYVLNKPADDTPTAPTMQAPPVTSATPTPPPPPPPPAEIVGKLAADAAAPIDLKPLAPNAIEAIATFADNKVKKGDVIAKMTGAKKLEDEIATETKAIAREQTALDAANKEKASALDPASAAKFDDKIKDKTAAIAKHNDVITAKKAELEKLEVIAPEDGTLAVTAKVGDRTGDAIGKLTVAPKLVASFATKTPPANGASVTLVHKADGASLTCTVTESTGEGFKATCDGAAAKADDDVAFKP